MSSIFQYLDEIDKPDNSQVLKPLARSKTSHEIKSNVVKIMGGSKPKGLSIRSISEMNVSHTTRSANIKKNIHNNKEQDLLKLKVTQVDNNGTPISPGKKVSEKKQTMQSVKYKGLTFKEETVIDKTAKTQMTVNNDVFKKPLPPKRFIKRFPEPQKLANCYDFEYEFNYGHIEVVEKDFKDKENLEFYKEEEFLSELKTPIPVEIPRLIYSKSFEEEYKFSPLELPEISDNED